MKKIGKKILIHFCAFLMLLTGSVVSPSMNCIVTAYAASAYIYNPTRSDRHVGKYGVTYRLTVPVKVTVPHTKVKVQMSSGPKFVGDDQTEIVKSSSTDKIKVDMGRWAADEPKGKNKLYVRVGYYTSSGKWSGWVASCAVYY